MALIAIVHLPDHTADDVETLLDADGNMSGEFTADGVIVAVHEWPNRAEVRNGCYGCAKGKLSGWVRHSKGYMVCMTCGKRNPKVRRWFIGGLFDWFGANLLGNNAPALFRTPEGYGDSRGTNPNQIPLG